MYWLHFDRSRLAGYQGICFRRLYHPEDARTYSFLDKAQRALTDALALLEPGRIQRRPTLLIDIAGTYAQEGDVEMSLWTCDSSIVDYGSDQITDCCKTPSRAPAGIGAVERYALRQEPGSADERTDHTERISRDCMSETALLFERYSVQYCLRSVYSNTRPKFCQASTSKRVERVCDYDSPRDEVH